MYALAALLPLGQIVLRVCCALRREGGAEVQQRGKVTAVKAALALGPVYVPVRLRPDQREQQARPRRAVLEELAPRAPRGERGVVAQRRVQARRAEGGQHRKARWERVKPAARLKGRKHGLDQRIFELRVALEQCAEFREPPPRRRGGGGDAGAV